MIIILFKRYIFRLYPNKQQEELIQKTFGCARFVYNQTLAHRQKIYEETKEKLSRFDCINWATRFLKNNYSWLKEPDSRALNSSIEDMDIAYQRDSFKESPIFQNLKAKEEGSLTELILLV